MKRERWRPANLAPRPVRVSNALGTEGGSAALYIYDVIDSWGGAWGVSSTDVVQALSEVRASRLDVHLNSPGGDYFEAVAIYAALNSHSAAVHVYVDGLAASAASVIAMAGESVTMAQGSQMMIHEPVSYAQGRASELRSVADQLDKVAGDIAGFYAGKAGGDVEPWRAAMTAETWYTADEAVEAGLADQVAQRADAEAPVEEAVAAYGDRWIAAAWKFAGREAAPAPESPGRISSRDMVDIGAVIRASVRDSWKD